MHGSRVMSLAVLKTLSVVVTWRCHAKITERVSITLCRGVQSLHISVDWGRVIGSIIKGQQGRAVAICNLLKTAVLVNKLAIKILSKPRKFLTGNTVKKQVTKLLRHFLN